MNLLRCQYKWNPLSLGALPNKPDRIRAADAVPDRVVEQDTHDVSYLGAR
jgi:hypothetical protein